MEINKAIVKALKALDAPNVCVATVYITPKLVVRISRRTYKNRKFNPSVLEYSVTAGKPNFASRKFIKEAIAAKEPFPIKKVQLKILKKK